MSRINTSSLTIFILLCSSLVEGAAAIPSESQSAVKACQELQRKLPGLVHFPGSSEYLEDIDHYSQASSQNSTCSVTPRSIEDVQTTIKIIGRQDIRSPFALKSGGHAFNPGFSSTPGVQIALHNLVNFDYDPKARTVQLGTGITWDQVYARLATENVTAVGGRVPGVGMGLLYGGGLSWYTSQYGLASDNAVAFDLVLPNGTYVNVTQQTQPDLYFTLRGGLNNFGIITGVTVKTWPSSGVWGGGIQYSLDYNDRIMEAIEDFSYNCTDPKAQLQAVYTVTKEKAFWEILYFYDGLNPSPEPFKNLLSIPSLSDATKLTTHSQLVQDTAGPPVIGSYLHNVPIIRYTVPILQSVQRSLNAAFERAQQANKSTNTLLWSAEPFYKAYEHSTYPSAFPHSASNPTTPAGFWFHYDSAASDEVEFFRKLIIEAAKEVQTTVVEEGQGKWNDTRYSNYAVRGTTVEEVFGESLPRMRQIKAKVDPTNIMGLQGEGFLI